MNKQSLNTSEVRAEQAASKKYQTMKLGLDVHADTIVVSRILDNSAPQPAQTLMPEKFLVWVKSQVAQADAVYSCYEAGPFGFVLHRRLSELGVKNLVVQPVCLDEQHKGVNHDKSDARELVQRLDRYVAGNTRALATVRVPTEAEEQKRIQSRQREQLKRELQRIAAQGRGLLLSQGCRQRKSWWQEPLWERLKGQLPGWLVERLEVFRRVLEEAAPAQLPKGLGGVTYETICREIGDWNRFTNRRQVGSYTGLCGGVSASGKTCHLLPITKHGNVRLRTALIELAWRMVWWQKDCKAVKKWRLLLEIPPGRLLNKAARKKAIVAIARQMAVDLWRWRTGKVKAQDLGWVMVGANG